MTIMNPYLLLLAHNITSYDLISTTQANKYRTYKETLSEYCHESDYSQIRILIAEHSTLVRAEQTLLGVRLLHIIQLLVSYRRRRHQDGGLHVQSCEVSSLRH